MRTITDHIVPGSPGPQLEISVLDEPGHGGAHHDYRVSGTYTKGEKAPIHSHMDDAVIKIGPSGETTVTLGRVKFQNGPIKEFGVNGLTHEALAAILIDRLVCFQAGPFANAYNQSALFHFRLGLESLKQRTVERIERGVEGLNVK